MRANHVTTWHWHSVRVPIVWWWWEVRNVWRMPTVQNPNPLVNVKERTWNELNSWRWRGVGLSGASNWQWCIGLAVPPFSSTNTQEPRTYYRRPLVLNLPTNHWESAYENIQCKSTNYQTYSGYACRCVPHYISFSLLVEILRVERGIILGTSQKTPSAMFVTTIIISLSRGTMRSTPTWLQYVNAHELERIAYHGRAIFPQMITYISTSRLYLDEIISSGRRLLPLRRRRNPMCCRESDSLLQFTRCSTGS